MTSVSDGDITSAATTMGEAAAEAYDRVNRNRLNDHSESSTLSVGPFDTALVERAQSRLMDGCTPHPDGAANIGSLLEKAADGSEGLMAGDVGAVSGLADFIGAGKTEWSGSAAENFESFYIQPFNDCRHNQIAVLGELGVAAATLEELLKNRRKDYVAAAESATEALDALGCGLAEAKLTLTIVGTLVTVLGAIPTGGATLSMSAIGAAGSVLSTSIATAEHFIAGQDYKEILESLITKLDTIDEAVTDMADDLAGKLRESSSEIGSTLDSDRSGSSVPMLLPHEPDVDNGPPRVTDGDGAALDGEFNSPS